jgi:ornithine cyclodeaminase/alanine dehydrogenase-like protein (mu-crystallin family)
MRVLILGHDDVKRALPPEACADAMARVLAMRARGEAYNPLRSVTMPPGAAGFMGLMPGWRAAGDDAPASFALKAICLIPDNPSRGLDTHQGIVTLFDGEIGVPTAILDASAITDVRTAAVTAVATRALAREDARTLAILGAGVQARSHLRALLTVRDFDTVRVYAPTAEHARAVLDDAPAVSAATNMTLAASPEEAVRGADVVVTATSSKTPVLRRDWLGPGVHVNAVGASMPSARELDVETVVASSLFCDSRESLEAEAGEYRLALEQGAIDPENHPRAELGQVLIGERPGRRNDEELTVFRSLGIAVEDLAAAEYAVAAARRHGIGTEVEL